MENLPILDFNQGWVTTLQLVLALLLPILVGLVTDRLTAGWLKVVLLGGLSFVATVLTNLLDALVTNGTLDNFDWANIIGSAILTWALAIVSYLGILKPTGITPAAQDSNVIQLFGPSAKREDAEYLAKHAA